MNFVQDPILGCGGVQPPSSLDQITAYNNECAQKIAEMQRRNGFTMQPQQSKTPTWDEIDKVTDSLTDSQKSFMEQNEEYVSSYQEVMSFLQREHLRILRPLVEQTKDGKDALDRHLTLIKRLKKSVLQQEEKSISLWREFTTNYSNMTWQEFLDMKKGKKGGTK